MARWNHQYVRQVAGEKEKYRGSDDLRNLLRLVTQSIYSDDIHYALELIQNAEDEGATQVDFRVTPAHIIVYNDGEPFDEDDVEAICSIKTGFKKNKIGFFGIGFKSVFNITDAPHILSGQFSFRIRDCLYPAPVRRVNRKLARPLPEPEQGALFILPIKRGKDASKLAKELETINDRLLLFLTSVQRITFCNQTGEKPHEWAITRAHRNDAMIVENTLLDRKTQWRVFSRTVRVPRSRKEIRLGPKKDVEQTTLVIAFPTPEGSSIPDLRSECLYCYLPTKRRPDMSFLVQGDFIPTLARENIDEDSPWNRWLLGEIAKLAADSYLELRKDSMFRDHLFDLIRLPDEVGDPLFKEVANQILNHLGNRAIAPVRMEADRWRKPSGVAIVPSELRRLLKFRDLKAMFGNRRQHADEELGERAHKVLGRLGAPEVGLSEVIGLLDSTEAVKSKSSSWFLDIYDYLAQQYEFRRLYDTKAEFERLARVPFLSTSDGRLVAPADYSGSDRLLVQHPQTKSLGGWVKMFDEGELVFLDRHFQEAKKDRRVKINPELEEKRKRVKAFLRQYGVAPMMRPYQIIQRVILPKFESGKFRGYPDEKLVLFTNYVRENLIAYVNQMRSQRKSLQSDEEAIADIRETLRLKGVYIEDGHRVEGYFSPSELYIDNHGRRLEPIARALDGIETTPYVSPIYRDRQIVRGYTSVPRRGRRQEVVDWDTFFEKLGVWRSPRLRVLEPVNLGWRHEGREWVSKPDDFSRYNRLCEDKVLPDLELLLQYYKQDPVARHKQVRLFRDLLAEFWEQDYQPKNQCRHQWFYYNPHERVLRETSFYHQLCETPWLPVEGIRDQLFRPKQVYFKTPLNEGLLPRGIPFIEVKDDKTKAFYQAIGVNERPEKSEVLGHLGQIRRTWHGNRFPTDWPEPMGRIYRHILSSSKVEREGQEFQELVSAFRDEALIFLPSTQGNWWKPDQVFWEDRNDVFGDLRGYLGPYYNPGVKRLFGYVGVKATPSVSDCLKALEALTIRWARSDTEEQRPLKGLVDRIYGEINRLLEMQVGIDVSVEADVATDIEEEVLRKAFDRPLYLTDAEEGEEQFVIPAEVYYCDDEQLRGLAAGKVHLLWLQTDWHLYRTFFQKAGIEPLSSIVSVDVVAENPMSALPDEVQFLRELAFYLRPYLKYHHSKQFVQWDRGEALTRLETLDVQMTPALRLEYRLDGQPPNVIPNVPAYYEGDENRLYVLSHSNWLLAHLDAVSRELARIFESLGVPLKTQIESLLSGGFDEEARLGKFESFGIPQRMAGDFIEPIQLRLREGRHKASKAPQPEVTPDREADKPKETTVEVGIGSEEEAKPTMTVVIEHWEDLISLEDIQGFRGEIDRHQQVVVLPPNVRPTSGPKGDPGKEHNGKGPRTITKSTVGAGETEALAIELVIAYERSHGRTAKDVHHIKNIGYDVKSTGRYIEIKSVKRNAGQISFEPSEWEAAERYNDSYYLYIVSNLLKGQTTRLRVIRNPYKYLQVYVPGKRIARNWERAVSENMEVVLVDERENEYTEV